MEYVKLYNLRFVGVFGRNRTPKRHTTTLFRVMPEHAMPLERIEEMALAQLSAIKAKSGAWEVYSRIIEVRTGGIEIHPLGRDALVAEGVR